MSYQAAPKNPSRDDVALQHDGDVAFTQPLKDNDGDRVISNPLCEASLAPTKAK